MFARRAIFAVLFLVTMAGSLWLAAVALTPGGFGILDLAALVLFAVTLPWMVAGFCECRDRLHHHALFRRSGGGGTARGRADRG